MTLDDLRAIVAQAGALGIPEVDPAPLLATPAADRPVLVDIRPPEERAAEGAIPHTPNVPMDHLAVDLDQTLAGLGVEDASTPIVCYCRRGNRTRTAVLLLRELGWTNAVSLRGGIRGWSAAGGTLISGTGIS